MATRSIYNTFKDEYGRDPIRERYGMNEYTYEAELRRRQREANARASEEQAFGLELRNAKELAAMEYDARDRVDTEAQAADFFSNLPKVKSPKEVIDLMYKNRKAVKDPAAQIAAKNTLDEFERLVQLNEKAASLSGYFGDYKSAVEQGMAPEDAFASAQVQRTQDITRSRLEGLGIKAPEDPKEMERLAARAESMEPDIATRQMLSADISRLTKIVEDIEADPEERAAALVELQTARKTMLGARALAQPSAPVRLSSEEYQKLYPSTGN